MSERRRRYTLPQWRISNLFLGRCTLSRSGHICGPLTPKTRLTCQNVRLLIADITPI